MLVLLGVVALGALVAGCMRAPSRIAKGQPPRNVLLITVDTLRADAIGAYGNAAAATPAIDRLAAGGTRFDDAHAHTVLTLPSHASILTGRLPIDHGIHDNAGFRLARGEETLATRLRAQGFRTAAFVSGFPLDSRFGLATGFEVYDDSFVDATPRPVFLEQERAGADTVAAALRWLRERDGERWFCWIHLYEPHFPYAPPSPLAARFADRPYAGEVAAADAALASILDPIVGAGGASDTLVVFTADHGESLGEHEEATHGIFAYESTLKVPLILHYPPLLTPRVVTSLVSHVDIMPTVLDILQLPVIAGTRGHSLIGAARGGTAGEETVYFEALSGSLNRGWAPLTGVIANGLKYIELPVPELYDLKTDPGETRNLASGRPADVEAQRTRLRTFPAGDVRQADETSEVKERLRALGYASGGKRSPPHRGGEDPKTAIASESDLQAIGTLYMSGEKAEALRRSRALVAQHPDMRVALLQLSQLERDAGNLPAAIVVLRQALELQPGDSETASLMAATLTAANRPAEAIQVLQPYASAADADVQVLVALGLAQARSRQFDDARKTLDRARAGDPSNAWLLVTSGTIEIMAGRRTEARKAFESALTLTPHMARAHSSLAVLEAEDGRAAESLEHWRRAMAADPAESRTLLAFGISLVRSGRDDTARPYVQLFADEASPARYGADIATARAWLARERR